MNNSAFRDLVSKNSSGNADNDRGSQFKVPSLGSRARSFIPMTPRNVKGYNNKSEFARQVAEQAHTDGPPSKRFKSSAAPKGSKLAQGYVDRAAVLRDQNAGHAPMDDRETRLKALEDMLKLRQITEEDFQQIKADMGIGGDTSSTHLVKGLDWKLLARARRGEDLNKSETDADEGDDNTKDKVDIDDKLEQALEENITGSQPRQREENQVTDDATSHEEPRAVTRDELLRRLKESRKAITETAKPIAAAPVLNDRFKKVAAPEKPSKHKYTEVVNGRRREVLEIRKSDGTVKRKTRWIDSEDVSKTNGSQPWGMDVPADAAASAAQDAPEVEDDDDDIFQGVGADYDPLADINSDESEQEADDKPEGNDSAPTASTSASGALTAKRNYFATDQEADEEMPSSNPLARDPTILAALKRAADIRRREEGDGDNSESSDPAQNAKQKAFLKELKERDRQDNADLDYGFGESRFGDDDEDGEIYVDDDTNDKKSGRKRGPKKRKGDKNDVKDVLSAMEGRNQKR